MKGTKFFNLQNGCWINNQREFATREDRCFQLFFFSHIISKLIFYVGKITVYKKDLCETIYRVLFIFSTISITSLEQNTE